MPFIIFRKRKKKPKFEARFGKSARNNTLQKKLLRESIKEDKKFLKKRRLSRLARKDISEDLKDSRRKLKYLNRKKRKRYL